MTTVVTTDVTNGDVTNASVMNNNFTAVKATVNGGIDNANINASAAIAISKLASYPADAAKVLKGDGTWAVPTSSAPGYSVTLPGSPTDGQEHILVDSITLATYQWRFRYNSGSAQTDKWEFVGGPPFIGTSFTTTRTGVYRAVFGGMWGNGGTTTGAQHSGLLRNNAVTETTLSVDAMSDLSGFGARQKVSGFSGDGTITIATVGHVIDTSGIDTPMMMLFPVRIS